MLKFSRNVLSVFKAIKLRIGAFAFSCTAESEFEPLYQRPTNWHSKSNEVFHGFVTCMTACLTSVLHELQKMHSRIGFVRLNKSYFFCTLGIRKNVTTAENLYKKKVLSSLFRNNISLLVFHYTVVFPSLRAYAYLLYCLLRSLSNCMTSIWL